MPTPTYTLIQEQVLGSAAATVTFSSIPGTYKDLVLEGVGSLSTGSDIYLAINSDTGSNYSRTWVLGNGSAAQSSRDATRGLWYWLNPDWATSRTQFQSYSNTNVNKTWLTRNSVAGNIDVTYVGLWRNTAAITSLSLTINGGFSFPIGTTFRLWGVAG